MAKMKYKNPRGIHVSPGVYTSETTLSYASKSLGITKLGVVGETLSGPAFQVMNIENWREFQTMFGGTNPKLFRGSQYPKYELPYIAKEYLKESNSIQVVRVLGLSGVNAGPAFVITAYGDSGKYTESNPMVVAVLRSRGRHKPAAFIRKATEEDMKNGICDDVYEYDGIEYYAKSVSIEPTTLLSSSGYCNPGFNTKNGNYDVNVNNYGTFTLSVEVYNKEEPKKYPVSLNPTDSNYIYNVLGADPEDGEKELFVEELYDVALSQLINKGEITHISGKVSTFRPTMFISKHKPVLDILTLDDSMLTRRNVGEKYLYSQDESFTINNKGEKSEIVLYDYDENGNIIDEINKSERVGSIYTVAPKNEKGKYKYVYVKIGRIGSTEDDNSYDKTFNKDSLKPIYKESVYVERRKAIFVLRNSEVHPITLDMNNYKEPYRYASTPWFVSELKGDGKNVEVNKLFRFHTISDGSNSNTMFKVSIENVDTELGTFDVKIRDFNDIDSSPIILERYQKCNLVPGSNRYLGLLVGTSDGKYNVKSKYVTVEINENDKTKTSVPAGFLGYPLRDYEKGFFVGDKANIQKPEFQYNLSVSEDIKVNRQYFGVSDITGIDGDILSYKGIESYSEDPSSLSPCFHLDSRITKDKEINQRVTVDGISGYTWTPVSVNNTTNIGIEPRIGKESEMIGSIYEDKRFRKFTAAFYGGWDGWDYYRESRSTNDEFQYSKYRGNVEFNTSGQGASVDVLQNAADYGINIKALNTDFYAYLAGIRQFANPKVTDINLLATPGIDYVNDNALVHEVIDMVEEERADCLYITTTPDKPYGASDSEFEMYTPDEAGWNYEDSEIDSNYSATYYPTVKYFDSDNSQYIYLPLTKDVLRSFAATDNVAYPWFAAAGWNRGLINGIEPKKKLTLPEQDVLYNNNINFVNTFAEDGMRIWGDKNMQIHHDVMDRISKRRLLLRIRKLCSIAGIGLLFDPNDNTTAKSFRSSITPILDSILENRGISDWRLEINDTPESRDRLELNCIIYLKPIGALEYININFVVTPQGTIWES